MRITTALVQVAAVLAAAGCGGSIASSSSHDGGGGDDGPVVPGDDASPVYDATGGDSFVPVDGGFDVFADAVCTGCGCSPQPTFTMSASDACGVLQPGSDAGPDPQYGFPCSCNGLVQGPYYYCQFPSSFIAAVEAENGLDGSTWPGPDAGMLSCPSSPATLTVTCVQPCTGRRTAGVGASADASAGVGAGLGARLAVMAHLEAVSVLAFERLERELRAHGAGPELLRDVRRARRDEVRHTAMTTRLAKRHGVEPVMPEAPSGEASARVRSLVEIAIENAVEGCVRETYGATQGLVEARVTTDRTMARLMKGIAVDECRHAELAWTVHAWAMARLGENDRARVREAMRVAVAELATSDPRGAGLLFRALPIAA